MQNGTDDRAVRAVLLRWKRGDGAVALAALFGSSAVCAHSPSCVAVMLPLFPRILAEVTDAYQVPRTPIMKPDAAEYELETSCDICTRGTLVSTLCHQYLLVAGCTAGRW